MRATIAMTSASATPIEDMASELAEARGDVT